MVQAPLGSVGRRTRGLWGPLGIGLFLLILGGAALFGHVRANYAPDLTRYAAAIERSAAEFGVDPNLVRGLMAAESSGDPDAVSHAGAMGLLQLMPATAKEEAERLRIRPFTPARLHEPELNIRLGTSYLSRLLARFGGEEAFALAAYNAGATRVRRWQAAAPGLSPQEVIRTQGYEETATHMERVLHFRELYRVRYPNVR